MPKHKISLLDTLPSSRIRLVSREVQGLISLTPIARRYFFDSTASEIVGSFIRDDLDLMIQNIDFARPPYDTVYIELDVRALWKGWRPNQPTNLTMDNTVGFLIHKDAVAIIAGDLDENVIGMWTFRFNRPQSIPIDTIFGIDYDRATQIKNAYVFGGQRIVSDTHRYNPHELQIGQEISFPELSIGWTLDQISAHFDLKPAYPDVRFDQLIEGAFLGGGDPITVITCLLLLNQPSKFVTLEQKARTHGIVKGKRKTFKEFHEVKINLVDVPKIRKSWQRFARSSPVMHDVSGHWKNFNKHDDCEHTWEPIGQIRTSTGNYKNYWCPKCLQRRTWTESFVRGNALLGVATKDYKITR